MAKLGSYFIFINNLYRAFLDVVRRGEKYKPSIKLATIVIT